MKKSWKLILIALLAALLVCTCMSAMAEEECKHPNLYNGTKDEETVYTCVSGYGSHIKKTITKYVCPDCNAVITYENETEVPHSYADNFTGEHVDFTCTTDGYDKYFCKYCNASWTIVTDKAPGHTMPDVDSGAVEWVEGEYGPDCLQYGYYIYDCPVCGTKGLKEQKTRIQHSFKKVTVPATCKAAGYTADVCERCSKDNNRINFPKLDHLNDWEECIKGSWAPIENATCTKDGKQAYTCKWCDQLIYDIIPKTGHRLEQDEKYIVKEPTCTEEGIGRAVCTNPLCDYYEDGWRIPALDHHIVAHNPKEESGMPTCTAEGTATYYEACDRCGLVTAGTKTPIPALGHKYEGETEMVIKPTCTSYGLLRVWCARCGDRDAHIDKQVPMVAHVHSDADEAWRTDVNGSYPATCMNTGIAVNLCVNCGGDPQTKVLAKLDHSYASAKDAAAGVKGKDYKSYKPATCTAAGSIEIYCKYGCLTTKTESIAALGHSWDEKNATFEPASKVPTCTTDVRKTHKCSRPGCNAIETVVVTPALGHLYGPEADPRDKAPTCTEDGIRYGTCTREGCLKNGVSSFERIPSLGHKAGAAVVTAATCIAEGKTETKCERCGIVMESKAIPKTAHTPVDKVVTEATTSKEGLIETRCSVCNTLLGTKAIPKKPSSSSGSGSGSSSSGSGTGSTVVSNVVTGTINSAGVSAAELGATSTAMVTPIDLSVDGTYTYSLVANGQYVVGTVTFVVSNGTFSASYTVNPGVVVSAPSLVVFANVDALKAGTATTVGFNAIFDGAGDTKVIAAVTMVGTFSTTSATPYVADAAQVAAMKAIVD